MPMATPTTRGKTPTTGASGSLATAKIMSFTQIQNRIEQLCDKNNTPYASIGSYFGSALPLAAADHSVQQYVGRIWLWNGMTDLAAVIAPSLETAVNQAIDNATVMLPHLLKQAGLTRRAA